FAVMSVWGWALAEPVAPGAPRSEYPHLIGLSCTNEHSCCVADFKHWFRQLQVTQDTPSVTSDSRRRLRDAVAKLGISRPTADPYCAYAKTRLSCELLGSDDES